MERKSITSGVEQLDHLLGGLFIGDNVVWHDDAGSLARVYVAHFLEASRAGGKPIIYISFDLPPKTLLKKLGPLSDYAGLTILDCFTCGKGESSSFFTKFYDAGPGAGGRIIKVETPGDISAVADTLYGVHGALTGDVRLVFESLTGMQELWGGEESVVGFYRHSCPRLYELETVAYWVMEKKAHSTRFKAQIGQIAQVVIELAVKRGTTSLAILKADGRENLDVQKPHSYCVKGKEILFGEDRRSKTGLALGWRIKDLRTTQGISQTELARLVGVTPSTISQVESSLIFPSLPALLKIAEILNVEVSSFFKDPADQAQPFLFSPDAAVATRLGAWPQDRAEVRRLIPLDVEGRLNPYLIELKPGESLPGHFFAHKGEEFGYLISGRVDVRIGNQNHHLEPGWVVYLRTETPSEWHNPGHAPAVILWCNV